MVRLAKVLMFDIKRQSIMLNHNHIKKIFVISLTNIGDIILTFPVIDILKRDFPEARIDVMIGPNGETLVKNNPSFGKIYLYHKKQSPVSLLKLIQEFSAEHYDLVVDLRNSLIPFLIFAKHRTSVACTRIKNLHKKQEHLARLHSVHPFDNPSQPLISFNHIAMALPERPYVVIAPGSRAENKRWHENGFAKVADHLIEHYRMTIVLTGDSADEPIVNRIKGMMKHQATDLTGKLSLAQLGYVISQSRLAVVNDSAPLHLASYLNIPVAAFFGPTDPRIYGPWSDRKVTIRKNINCQACCGDKKQIHDCIRAISSEEAMAVLEPWFKDILHES